MRQYETAFLIAPNIPEEEIESLISQMAEVITKKKGKILNQESWGKRKLAYSIQNFDEAFYMFFNYEGERDIPAELERRFRQTESVIRYLTVKKDESKNLRKKKKIVRKNVQEEKIKLKDEKIPSEASLKEANKEEEVKDGKRIQKK